MQQTSKIILAWILMFSFVAPVAVAADYPFLKKITEKTNLLVLGDVHHDVYENSLYPDIISAVLAINPNMDCVFLEHPQDFQNEINRFFSGKVTWKQYSEKVNRKFVIAIESLHNSRFKFIGHGDVSYFANKEALAITAKEKHIAIYAVDSVSKKNLLESIEDRDQVMAEKTVELFRDKKCRLALFPVGNAHFGMISLFESAGLAAVSSDFDMTDKVFRP